MPPEPARAGGARRGRKPKPIPRIPLLQIQHAPENGAQGGTGPGTVRVLTVAEKRQTAWDLRIAGYSVPDIAVALELSGSRVYDFIKEYGADIAKYTEASKDEWRTLELARLDKLLLGYWRQRDASPKYADIVLRVLERKHKLLGLDTTHKHITTDTPQVGISLANLDLSRLTNQELEWLEIIVAKATPVELAAPVLDAQFVALPAPT